MRSTYGSRRVEAYNPAPQNLSDLRAIFQDGIKVDFLTAQAVIDTEEQMTSYLTFLLGFTNHYCWLL